MIGSSALGRVMPSRFILASSVVALSPSSWAAPRGPLTRHPVSSSAWTIRSRVSSWRVGSRRTGIGSTGRLTHSPSSRVVSG